MSKKSCIDLGHPPEERFARRERLVTAAITVMPATGVVAILAALGLSMSSIFSVATSSAGCWRSTRMPSSPLASSRRPTPSTSSHPALSPSTLIAARPCAPSCSRSSLRASTSQRAIVAHTSPTTTRTPRATSRPSSTTPPSRSASVLSSTASRSAAPFSLGTTTSTTIAASSFSLPPTCISAEPATSYGDATMAAYHAHPERFVQGAPRLHELPRAVYINPPAAALLLPSDQPATAPSSGGGFPVGSGLPLSTGKGAAVPAAVGTEALLH